jgi:parallel beta-helix repeat protein
VRYGYLMMGVLISALGLSSIFYMGENPLTNKDSVNVKANYELVGDGITDDTHAIQKAIYETPAGGTLRVPPGEYKVSRNPNLVAVTGYGESYFALEVTKGITIEMEGVTLLVESDKEHGVFWVYDAEEVHLNGGSIIGDGFPENEDLTSNIAILFQDTFHSSVENMYLKNHSQGVHLHHSDYNVVRNVTSEYNYGSGIISFASNHNLIDSCTVRNSSDGHLSLYGNGSNNHVRNCEVQEDRPEYTYEQGITIESEYDSLVEGNTVSGFYFGIDVKNDSESNIIKGNEVFNNKYNIAVRPGDGGVDLKTESNNIQIIDNIAIDPREDSIYGIYIGVGKGHVVTGNTLNQGHLIITDKTLRDKYINSNTFVDE